MSSQFWLLNKVVSRKAIEANKLKTAQVVFLSLQILFIYFFRERGREGEREGEKHQCVVAPHAPSGDLAPNPGMCPDWESNQQHFGSQPMLNPLSYTSMAGYLTFEDVLLFSAY